MMYRTNADNSGISLIELIVVVLIISIISVSAVITVSAYMNADVQSAAKKLGVVMNNGRSEALAQNGDTTEIVVRVFEVNSNYYAGIYKYMTGNVNAAGLMDENRDDVIAVQKLGSTSFTITAAKKETLTDARPVTIDKLYEYSFNKATGALGNVYERTASGGTYGTRSEVSATSKEYTDIILSGSDTYKVFFTVAGRCISEQVD